MKTEVAIALRALIGFWTPRNSMSAPGNVENTEWDNVNNNIPLLLSLTDTTNNAKSPMTSMEKSDQTSDLIHYNNLSKPDKLSLYDGSDSDTYSFTTNKTLLDSFSILGQHDTGLMYDYNDSVPEMFHPSSYERGFLTSANVGIFLCTVGIFFNLILVALLLSSKKLRVHYLYIQVLSIAIADTGFIIMVDSFTVYFELQPWRLGAAFCKTWMILDVALPSVSLMALLILNIDRVLFIYRTHFYHTIMQHTVARAFGILTPWCISCTIVCTLWLGFPKVEPRSGVCMYGITQEANAASSWLTVFIPSLLILVLLIFVFIAVIGEMPTYTSPLQPNFNSTSSRPVPDGAENEPTSQNEATVTVLERNRQGTRSSISIMTQARKERRFVAALLAVDFVSLAITLPYSAFSLVSPICTDSQSCDSLRTLFQTLSWMRSSVACIRPIFFILLTDIYHSFKKRIIRWYVGLGYSSESSSDNSDQFNQRPTEMITMTRVTSIRVPCGYRSMDNSTTTTVMTPPHSPHGCQGPELWGKAKTNGTGLANLFKDEGTFV